MQTADWRKKLADKVLEVKNLTVQYDNGKTPVVCDFNFFLEENEILCINGKSGSGKSTVVWALMEMLEDYHAKAWGEICCGSKKIVYDGRPHKKRILNWREIALVPQASMTSFHPLYSIGKTFMEMLDTYEGKGRKEWKKQKICELLEMVKLDSSVYNMYPHELSGGMKQRAAIALGLLFNPEILILDEATTGLDLLVEAQVLGTILELKKRQKMSILFISHDRNLAEKFSTRQILLSER